MIEWERLINALRKRCSCSRTEAIDALGSAYLTLDKSRTEPEQVAYLLQTGYFEYLRSRTPLTSHYAYKRYRPTLAPDSVNDDGDIVSAVDNIPQPEHDKADNDFVIEVTANVPVQYRIPTVAVTSWLLNSRCQNHKPLTVEQTRQILMRHRIKNASELSRQVYTFLTTIKETL